jgi:UvrD-like helicase C-terminal domain
VICADADVQATAQALRSAGLAFTVLGADGSVLGAGGSVPDLDSGVADSDRTGQSEMSGDGTPDISDISDISQMADRLTLVPVTLAKGLEFDHVVLVEPGRIATGEAYGLRRLYVALTRAVSRLTVFHAEPLPAELSLHTIRAAFELGPFRGRRPPRASQPGVRAL